jgi:CBS-domain-containing membrane protein
VYDYVPGKVDWLARGLPTEGERADEERVGDRARDDVVTCRLDAPVEPVRDEIDASRYGFALVTTEDGTLLGRLRGSSLEDGVSGTAEEHMDPGPSTVRPDMAIADLRERLDDKGLKTAIVSTPEGRLMGVVTRGALD